MSALRALVVVAVACRSHAPQAQPDAQAPAPSIAAKALRQDPCVVENPPMATGLSPALVVDGQASTLGGVISLALADLDGDGSLDAAVARGGADASESGVLEVLYGPFAHGDVCGGGAKSVQPSRTWHSAVSRPFSKVAVGDLDGDGCKDVVVGDFGGGAETFHGAKNGARCELGASEHVDVVDPSVALTDVKLADLDGDGRLDLVAARSARAAPTDAQRAAIAWNRGGKLDFTHPWLSEESLVASFVALVIDANGDGVPDVVFGARGENTNAKDGFEWGSLHLGAQKTGPSPAHVPLRWATAPTKLSEAPYVVDLDAWSSGPANVLVTASEHLCDTPPCHDAAVQRVYAWSGGTFADASAWPQTSGDWLPGAVGALDDDARPDAVYPFACGTRTQSPGRLVFFRSAVGNYAAQQLPTPDEVVRAAEIGDVDPATHGLEVVVGAVKPDAGGGSTNTGHVSIIFHCPNP